MSRLTVYDDQAPEHPRLRTEDPDRIAAELASIGVRFERWDSPVAVSPEDDADTVLAAYRPHLDQLMGAAGSADVIRIDAATHDYPGLRRRFLAEHVHTEDEVRFFVHGEGSFVMHAGGQIFDARCMAGDLISVPTGIPHWFDAGEAPCVTALRVFTDTAGWVAHYTGDDVAERFPAR